MSICIVYLLVFGCLTISKCFQLPENEIELYKFFNESVSIFEDVLGNEKDPELISECINAIKEIKIIQNLQLQPTEKNRNKRQATFDCPSLKSQISSVQSQIVSTQKSIANQTATLNGYNQKIAEYQLKISTTSPSNVNIYQNLLNTFVTLANSMRNSINNLNNQLTVQQAQEASFINLFNSNCASSSPCGTFVRYDTVNGRTDPEMNGFLGGKILFDNSNAYVGYGSAVGCSNQLIAPAAISTSWSSPGSKVPCGTNEISDSNSAYYLLYHPNLTWITTSTSEMFNVPNTLRVNAAGLTFLFGRVLINGQYILGKVSSNGLNFAASNGNSLITSGFDVLTCAISSQSCPCQSTPATFAPITAIPISPSTQPQTVTQPPTQAPTNPPAVQTQPPITAAPTNPPSSGTFSCPSAGLFANPSDCSSYFNCPYAGASPAPSYCGSGLRWNDSIKNCDFAANVPNCGTVVTNPPTLPPVTSTSSPTEVFTTTSTAASPDFTTSSTSRPFFCYWPEYRALSQINPSLCTHISYAFFTIDSNGAIAPQGDTSKFLAVKNSHPNVKLLISIGGGSGGFETSFLTVASNPSLRANFVNNVLNYVRANGIHGVDIDWENLDPQPNQASLTADLLQDLWNALSPNYLVTIAVQIDNNKAAARYDIARMVNNVHFINLMTYDYHGGWESVTGFNAPLYSPISTVYTVDASVQYWLSKVGSKKNILLLGFAFYGQSWTTSGTTVGSSGSGAPQMTYAEICKNIRYSSWTPGYDNVQKSAYAYGGGRWVGYDSLQSIQDKIDYLNNNGLGGAMVWEIAQDDLTNECGDGAYPLTTLIKNAMSGSLSSSQPVATNPPAVQTQPPITAAPTNPPSSGTFSCPSAGLFANPSDCSSFYNCPYAGPAPAPNLCGSGLRWNDSIKNCDYAANVPNCGGVATSAPSVYSPTSAQISSLQFTGDLTYYNEWNGAYGSCGLVRSLTDPYYVAALSRDRMSGGSTNPNNHPLCAPDKCIKIRGVRGTVVVKISDTCGACKFDDVDIADSVFPLLDDPTKGRVQVTWEFCDCTVLGKI